jgi:ATP citrate (pro-S)-lyase
MIVLLGEVGGNLEYEVCEALAGGRITKSGCLSSNYLVLMIFRPLVAWCTGTCADMFGYEVQFGHAGACAQGKLETASAKNAALRASGAIVPANFEEFASVIFETYTKLVKSGWLSSDYPIDS